MILVVLAGLPGSGKSTVARALAAELDAPVLDKDALRAALFGPRHVEYSGEQDDLCADLLYRAAGWLGRQGARWAILDGRTFARRVQREALGRAAAEHGFRPVWVECLCAEEVARLRIAQDRESGRHPAANRTPEAHSALRARVEPLEGPRWVLDTTDGLDARELRACLAHLRAAQGGP